MYTLYLFYQFLFIQIAYIVKKKETPKRQVVKLIDFILRTNICEKRFERKKKQMT